MPDFLHSLNPDFPRYMLANLCDFLEISLVSQDRYSTDTFTISWMDNFLRNGFLPYNIMQRGVSSSPHFPKGFSCLFFLTKAHFWARRSKTGLEFAGGAIDPLFRATFSPEMKIVSLFTHDQRRGELPRAERRLPRQYSGRVLGPIERNGQYRTDLEFRIHRKSWERSLGVAPIFHFFEGCFSSDKNVEFLYVTVVSENFRTFSFSNDFTYILECQGVLWVIIVWIN